VALGDGGKAVIPVLHLGRPKWDQGLVMDLLEGRLAAGGHQFEKVEHLGCGGVILAPLGAHEGDIGVARLQAGIDNFDWVVVLGTADEAGAFPWRELKHPNMHLWLQTPHPENHVGHDRFLLVGYPPDTPEMLRGDQPERGFDWNFMGQVNHERREKLYKKLRRRAAAVEGGLLVKSDGFTKGWPRDEYLDALKLAKIVPCPSGPATPDTFRLAEALEAGCVPLVDQFCPAYEGEYWPMALGHTPLHYVPDWKNVDDAIDVELSQWPRNATRVSAWWQQYKRELHWRINDDVTEVSGISPAVMGQPQPTILIPVSPIPSHPDTLMVDQVVASVRHWFQHHEIILMCDGVRPEQEHRRADYEEALNRLMWLCEHEWGNTLPLVFDDHTHQAEMARVAMRYVRTPTILYVESDCPIVTDCPIDWPNLTQTVGEGLVNMVRLHHEAIILPESAHLNLDKTPVMIGGVPLLRTFQWSQRPHLANSDYYRRILQQNFRYGVKSMIEDKMHSVVQCNPWGAHRVAIYAPGDNLKRSWTLDGRQDDPKWESEL